ncbi:hypothetical protein NEOLEDRAFT_1141813 [Neolentinus lepideus HHB14362 ss-1]|uniref:LysM domain-containing protein n=1 Tax=Neolentinus lepideus HHB14362 ss-1 TaxID=1314782 RepID=A0A165NHY2_9AGAM|nr:hypothetical protein NEOLEDRAFT_1141813 [Neolentinus lepideus HHB14362 ss-1]
MTASSTPSRRPPAPLCLACSSSLPPKLSDDVFLTRCCMRPICLSCTAKNPRLTRYDPCLACLGGVSAVSARTQEGDEVRNVDAGVRDEDVFVLGDDEDDGDVSEVSSPKTYSETLVSDTVVGGSSSATESQEASSVDGPVSSTPAPSKYYIQPGDTLLGIALKFHVDGRRLCRLNNLPSSTLSTTPHILHTRRFLTLPPSAKTEGKTHVFADGVPTKSEDALRDKVRQDKRRREVARSRFQMLTKEADWDVVQAYVAIADDSEDEWAFDAKRKEGFGEERRPLGEVNGTTLASGSCLEGRAVSRYLDDEEWEAGEMRDGRGVVIQRFPMPMSGGKSEKARTSAGRGRNVWSIWGL